MQVIILGTGAQARVVPDIITVTGNTRLLGFVKLKKEINHLRGDAAHYPVYEESAFPDLITTEYGDYNIFIGTAHFRERIRLINLIKERNLPLATIIHPTAVIAKSAHIGKGTLIMAGSIIGPGASIGDHVIINSAVTIDHDCVIQPNVIIGPGTHLAGVVIVGSDTFIGIGSCCNHGITVGRNCVIGAGSVIIKNIPDDVIAAGVPAEILRKRRKRNQDNKLT